MASTIKYVPQPVTRFPDDLSSREAAALVRTFAIQVDRYLQNLSDVTIPSVSGGVMPSDLLDYLFLPGRAGGQLGTWSDTSAPYLTINTNIAAAGSPVHASVLKIATSDGSTVLSVGDDGATTIATPYNWGSGNPILLSLDMIDNTTSPSTIFRIRTGAAGNEVHKVSYNGTTTIDMTANSLALLIDQTAGATADFAQLTNGSAVVLLGINSAGDLYGGHLATSSLLLMSNDLAASTTSRISLLSSSTDITFDNAAAGGYIPFRFGLGLASGTLTGLSANINITSTGGNPGAISVSNVGGSNASILYKAIRIATQTGDLFEFLDSNGTTKLSFVDKDGAWNGPIVASGFATSFQDNLFSIFDNTTPTKIAQFQASTLPVGTSTFNFPALAAAGTATLAALEKAQTFTAGQTITTPDDTQVLLTVQPTAGGSVSDILRVYDRVGTFAFALDSNASLNQGGSIIFWPSGTVGSGFAAIFLAQALTASRNYILPDVTGNVMVRAGTLDRASLSTVSTATVLTAANSPAGAYQANVYFCTGATAGDKVFKVELLWRDARADTAAADRSISITNGYSVASLTSAPQQFTGMIYTSGTTAIRIKVSLVSGTTGNYDLRVRINAA